jgi:peptide/nickel transport system ATP-binding protein
VTSALSTSESERGNEPARPAAEAGDPLVEIDDLAVTFRRGAVDLPALRHVSLEIGRGEILGIVGESGSGKTVLGLSILGLLRAKPDPRVTGAVRVLGVDMVTASDSARRSLRRSSLGAIFQDPMTSLNPTMRVGKQLEEVTHSADEAMSLLDAVGIPDARQRLKAFPHELSGGQRQRVMIAMAIAGNPSLVIADEPTTALDVTVQAQVLSLILELRDRINCSFVLVTHDLSVAAQVADRVAVLYGGRLVELGETGDVLSTPLHPYTVGLLHSRISLDASRRQPLATLPGQPPDPRRLPPGCPFAPRCPIAVAACDEALPELVSSAAGSSEAACIRLDAAQEVLAGTGASTPWPASKPARDTPRLSLRGVTKTFTIRAGLTSRHQIHALRGIDLDVYPGESLAVVGESGCGKSTLLRVIAGVVEADSGSAEIRSPSRPQMVFQDAGASLTPWRSIGELISERLRNDGVARSKLTEPLADTLRLVGLDPELARVKPGQLSGGQRQRAAIARAVVVPPSVLLCDEPTSALDVSLAATVLNLLGRLRRQLHLSVIFVTHDLAAARIVADRIAVMYLGEIVEIGPAEQIVAEPWHPYTKALIAAVPEVAHRGSPPVRGDPASPAHIPAGCPFHPRCPEAIDACREVVPPLAALDESERLVACIRAGEE